ncbi:hypothetical protein [Myceligenerans pegani]|uniref:Uncharacterized protein n=1 Tax=Myceligenerans pegani TaxID=2776917 RepID=A0ABR9N007_9MICO|nr:hypothetical protein [Myceligenerans sp. TRM 65318]MBE1876413.1 hypothetical protein [Myceligenerans sp. TRM 65318]MBE3018684.1 hypothetical protein [Myceligenerans sp. TRM 65318]
MFTRAVILPATALLVPGAAGVADPLAAVRLAACAALASLAENGRPMVLAHGPDDVRGPRLLKPSLAAAGIADRTLPDDATAPWAGHDSRPRAGTAASVALLCLSMALGDRAADVLVLEVPAEPRSDGTGVSGAAATGPAPDPERDPADAVAAHLASGGTLVVASGGPPGPATAAPGAADEPAPGVAAVLTAAGADSWTRDTRTFPQDHEHLPPEYWLTVCATGTAARLESQA